MSHPKKPPSTFQKMTPEQRLAAAEKLCALRGYDPGDLVYPPPRFDIREGYAPAMTRVTNVLSVFAVEVEEAEQVLEAIHAGRQEHETADQ